MYQYINEILLSNTRTRVLAMREFFSHVITNIGTEVYFVDDMNINFIHDLTCSLTLWNIVSIANNSEDFHFSQMK